MANKNTTKKTTTENATENRYPMDAKGIMSLVEEKGVLYHVGRFGKSDAAAIDAGKARATYLPCVPHSKRLAVLPNGITIEAERCPLCYAERKAHAQAGRDKRQAWKDRKGQSSAATLALIAAAQKAAGFGA